MFLALSTMAESVLALQTPSSTDFSVLTDRRAQAAHLVPALQALLQKNQVTFAALQKIGVVTGPGSFTGTRVGLAAAEGLALALDRPLIGFDAFTWWANAARRAGLTKPLAIALDTLRDDVFIAAYDGVRTLLAPQVMRVADATVLLDENNLVLVGNATSQLSTYNFAALSHVTLAEALLHLTATVDAGHTAPVYLRAPEISQPRAPKAMQGF